MGREDASRPTSSKEGRDRNSQTECHKVKKKRQNAVKALKMLTWDEKKVSKETMGAAVLRESFGDLRSTWQESSSQVARWMLEVA